jgi:hypothetical protein
LNLPQRALNLPFTAIHLPSDRARPAAKKLLQRDSLSPFWRQRAEERSGRRDIGKRPLLSRSDPTGFLHDLFAPASEPRSKFVRTQTKIGHAGSHDASEDPSGVASRTSAEGVYAGALHDMLKDILNRRVGIDDASLNASNGPSCFCRKDTTKCPAHRPRNATCGTCQPARKSTCEWQHLPGNRGDRCGTKRDIWPANGSPRLVLVLAEQDLAFEGGWNVWSSGTFRANDADVLPAKYPAVGFRLVQPK